MAFGQTREQKLNRLQPLPKPKIAEEPVIPTGNISIVNLEQKKKPYNVNIRNYNRNEPKIKPNMKYSDKQRYRQYKTKTEPNLLNKIMVNEDDDIINKIKEAFGIKSDSLKSNYSEPETAPSQFYKGVDEIRELPVEPREQREQIGPRVRRPLRRDQQLMEELNDITKEDAEELTFQKEPEYNFSTEFTPESKISKREHTLHEDDFSIFQEKQYPYTMAFATPEEIKILNRLPEEITPESHLLRTPEEKKKAQEDAERYLDTAELTIKKLKQMSDENVTRRRVGRPSGAYGPYKKRNDNTEF